MDTLSANTRCKPHKFISWDPMGLIRSNLARMNRCTGLFAHDEWYRVGSSLLSDVHQKEIDNAPGYIPSCLSLEDGPIQGAKSFNGRNHKPITLVKESDLTSSFPLNANLGRQPYDDS